MVKRRALAALLLSVFLIPTVTFGQSSVYSAPKEDIDKIKDEGLSRSQVMQTLSYMTDVIGPRLTASTGAKRANEWTRDTLAKWGVQNAHLESWGPFGRGWTLKKFYAMVDGPTAFPMIAYPKAWSPGTDTLMSMPTPAKKGKTTMPANPSTAYTGEVVRFTATKEEDLEQYKGKLKGKIVLVGALRELKAHFDAQAKRSTDKDLLELADAPDPASIVRRPQPNGTPNPEFARFMQQQQFSGKRLKFLADEGAAILIDAGRGDGGTIFVQQASAVQPGPPAPGVTPIRLYDKDAKIPIQISAAAEHFNRVARIVDAGEKVTMTVDLAVQYDDADLNGYNTVAEIPGSDKADEVVMLGGHLDSWQGGTGATDNGAGCAVMMEAMRILQTLGLKPRRTIRIALWTGEEQGLLGSRAYVKQHFGEMKGARNMFGPPDPNAPKPELIKGADYDKLSAYFNIDNGTGKVRGIYMQGNNGVREIFRKWFEPFKDAKWFSAEKDMSANTLTLSNTGGTDHLAFDAIGLPGFQFIQDEIEYDTRTHHSNMDVFDRIQADDMKQISIIVAAFVYQAAMMDEKMPRKTVK